ncbi:MAG TPA: iron ABC transporter permease [Deinococcales bacterium]|nr:iron ABC transporter permease [Deinococcales bacterium]
MTTRTLPAALAGAAAAAFLGVFLVWPLGVILVRSFSSPEGLGTIVSDPWYWRVAGFTFGQALLSTFLTLLAGLPAAIVFARWSFPGRRLLRSAFTIPFVMPTVVAGMGFLALTGPGGLLGINLRDSFALIMLAHVFYNAALVIRIVGSFLETAARSPEQAAATLGAGQLRILFRVTLPLATPAIIAAAALVFVLTFTSFGVLMILAPSWSTFEVEIYRLTARLLRLDAAAVLVVVQLLTVTLSTVLYTRWQARLATPVTGAAATPPPARGWQLLPVTLLLLPALLLTVAPLLALVVQTFFRTGFLPDLSAFRQLLEVRPSAMFPGVGRAVLNSVFFAGSSMVVALIVGACFAWATVRAGWRWLDSLSLVPLATSAVTLGFGYLLAFPQLTLSPWGIILAHSLIAFPFVTRSLLPALRGIPENVTAAAETLGAGPLGILRRVELPLLVPALLTAAAFAFAISLGEFGASLVITRPEYATVPVAVFDRLSRPGAANHAAALALSFLLMSLTGAIMLLFERPHRTEL